MAKKYIHQYQPAEDIQTVRIPILGSPGNRDSSQTRDQRFVNGCFWEIKNPITGKSSYWFVKRPGLTLSTQPSGGAAVGRGVYSWRNSVYSVFGNKIYKDLVDLGVTMATSTGLCSFAETRPGASTQYLCVTDGDDLFCITTGGNVVVLNNRPITSSSVANPTTITAVAHGLNTGNQIVIRNHSGSTPSLNGTVYTVTVTGVDTFTIPVNVTVGGTGGSIGVFPAPNLGKIIYADGYFFVLKHQSVELYNSELDDPTDWDPTKFITAQMYNKVGNGLARQHNLVLVYSTNSMQAFYNNANVTGSPFSNYEAAVQQVGCAAKDSLVLDEGLITWVGNSFTGGHTVWKLDGLTNIKEIATTQVRLILDAESNNLADATGMLVRIGGKKFYILNLYTTERTLVYDYELDIWSEFESSAGTHWPIVHSYEHNFGLFGQHESNGKLYTISPSVYLDDSVAFTVLARFGRIDLDTTRRKFVKSYDLIGDKQASTAPVLFSYFDDDYVTQSSTRTFDMNYNRPFLPRGGSFRRRAHQLSYTGATPLRLEGLEMRYRLGDN